MSAGATLQAAVALTAIKVRRDLVIVEGGGLDFGQTLK